MVNTNPYSYGLVVSTNYISSLGFLSGDASPTNVSYTYADGNPIKAGAPNYDLERNIANLLYNPRVPVFITNRTLGSNEFRFYLDLNRNGRFDTNGLLPEIGTDGLPVGATNFFVGDPEWIGGLEFPDRPHSASNPFIYRYAYLVEPVGNTLDLNSIYNYAKAIDPANMSDRTDSFLRDQGVGTWEINLAAFLLDLNTNQWFTSGWGGSYNYYTNNSANSGVAFDDALSLLRYRYGTNPAVTLASVKNLFGQPGIDAFTRDCIDGYSAGPPMAGTWWSADYDGGRVALAWAGANNVNHFFTPQDLFDSSKISHHPPPNPSLTFVDRLTAAGNGVSSYDRYTFYRLLSQLGTDSAPETTPVQPKAITDTRSYGSGSDLLVTVPNHGFYSGDEVTIISGANQLRRNFRISVIDADHFVLLGSGGWTFPLYGAAAIDPSANAKIDLNYDNLNYPRGSFTNWAATNFFTAAADRMLRRQNGMFLDHIPVRLVASNSFGVFTNNFYTPSVHRILQLAANIFDAARSHPANELVPAPPTVFRPIFRRDPASGEVFIAGYRQVLGLRLSQNAWFNNLGAVRMVDLDNPADVLLVRTAGMPIEARADDLDNEPMVWGVPLIVSARKGYPNFNEFAMQNYIGISRRMKFHRPPGGSEVTQTNLLYNVTITNTLGVEAWNSYASAFPRPLQIYVRGYVSAALTTNASWDGRNLLAVPVGLSRGNPTNAFWATNEFPNVAPVNGWPGYNPNQQAYSFQIPVATNFMVLSNSTYSPAMGGFVALVNTMPPPQTGPFYVPNWWLHLNTRLLYVLADGTNIVDYVNLNHSEPPLNLTAEMLKGANCGQQMNPGSIWCVNRMNGAALSDDRVPTVGMNAQILVGLGLITPSDWKGFIVDPSVSGANTKPQAIGAFLYNLLGVQNGDLPGNYTRKEDFFAPFVPVLNRFTKVDWQANDPLVHYTVGDLMDLRTVQTNNVTAEPEIPPLKNMGYVNNRYDPWGGGPMASSTPTIGHYELAAKDPLVRRSDNWDFPTNKYPNPGWLGRVHRGTPWQTVYLKSTNIAFDAKGFVNWMKWSGNGVVVTNMGQMDTNVLALYNGSNPGASSTNDAAYTLPVDDRMLFDIFTTAVNDNAAQGRMSVNQTNLAAWSAVLSGVLVLTNTTTGSALVNGSPPTFAPLAINPAGPYDPLGAPGTWPPLLQIINGINLARATNGGRFTRLGDILAAPQLTVASPYLNTSDTMLQQNGLSDEAYERIPQQILGLLKADAVPRFVIYSYGQALKPAEHSIVTSGQYFGLCTNYQITAEAATRAVVRVDGAPNHPHAVIESFNVLPPD